MGCLFRLPSLSCISGGLTGRLHTTLGYFTVSFVMALVGASMARKTRGSGDAEALREDLQPFVCGTRSLFEEHAIAVTLEICVVRGIG